MLHPVDTLISDRSFEPAASAQMERIVVDLRRMYQERNEALREVTRAHHEALLRLALAADFKDDDTGVHMVRIGYLAESLALALGQPSAFARTMRRAAPMHDVGKIGIPDIILKKAGSFTPEERTSMNRHAEIGAGILGRSRVPLFQLAAEVALTHHERWDGCGYPHGLAGEAIPLSGRIVAVVDFFDALTMDRCYRKAFTDDVALDMLIKQRGAAFDPAIVDAFLDESALLIELRETINRQPPSFEELAEQD